MLTSYARTTYVATRKQETLFGHAESKRAAVDPARTPLAERMRPRSVDEMVGQEAAVRPDGFLGRILRGATPRSCILWGPPGSGKTTIARLLAGRRDFELETVSAVLSGVKDLREIIERAKDRRAMDGRDTILFVDEIHRFNKAQQDAFLPHVEAGTIVLVGATTENPSFEINAPLLSRCRVVVLDTLDSAGLAALIDRALADEERGLGRIRINIDDDARTFLAERAGGDARAALGALEASADLAAANADKRITLALAEEGMQRKALLYDKSGDEHYNIISAFIKSMRGGSVDGSLYWMARMLEAGEDPMFIARRMVIFASEDVGLADPQALPLAVSVKDAVHFVGLPEARINLAHGVAYLAVAPKSNAAYKAGAAATAEVRDSGPLSVPVHLRNAPTKLMKNLGYGREYVYPHGSEEAAADQQYLPDALANKCFFEKD
jgi:putative ATPase